MSTLPPRPLLLQLEVNMYFVVLLLQQCLYPENFKVHNYSSKRQGYFAGKPTFF